MLNLVNISEKHDGNVVLMGTGAFITAYCMSSSGFPHTELLGFLAAVTRNLRSFLISQ